MGDWLFLAKNDVKIKNPVRNRYMGRGTRSKGEKVHLVPTQVPYGCHELRSCTAASAH